MLTVFTIIIIRSRRDKEREKSADFFKSPLTGIPTLIHLLYTTRHGPDGRAKSDQPSRRKLDSSKTITGISRIEETNRT